MCKVVNLKTSGFDVYIGRPTTFSNNQEHFGNPFSHQSHSAAKVIVANRDAAVKAFDDWLAGTAYQDVEPKRRKWILDNLYTLKGKTLGCWCKPEACHGDVLVKYVENLK